MEKEDVDLYKELENTLKTVDESEEKESEVASDLKPKEGVDTSKTKVEDENAELSEEDISKLTPRAQKRIREQAAEIKRLAEEATKKVPESPKEVEKKSDPHDFDNVKDFLSAVQDKDSRVLLEKFYNVMKKETSIVLAPMEQKNNEIKFETEFAQFEKIEGLIDYKNDIRQTFLRDPKQSIKTLIGEIVTDLQLNKVKPIEKTISTPNRGKVDTSNLSKDQLYDMLETMKE